MNFAIMAGGTGGHIFPGIAVAKTLLTRGHKVYWLGAKGGMEERIVRQYGLPLTLLPIKALRGKGILGILLMPFRLLNASIKARKFFNANEIDCAISMGGYVAGPGGLATRFNRVKLVVHEQNSVFGMTNKHLSKWADLVLTGFDLKGLFGSKWVGNPVRDSIEKIIDDGVKKTPINVLVLGGSQGAKSLNSIIPEKLRDFLDRDQVNIRHQCGKGNLAETKTAYQYEQVQVVEFIQDMAKAYAWADVCICRAGALTVAEVCCALRPSLFIPYPHAVDNHQRFNAQSVVGQGGGLIWQESESLDKFIEQFEDLIDMDKRSNMVDKLKLVRKTRVADMICDLCEQAFI